MDPNTAMVLCLCVPLTAVAISSGIAAKYTATQQKLRRNRSHIHPVAQIIRQVQGLDLKDDDELEVEKLKNEVEDLRRQLNSLRDTSTQYDLSIDHYLKDLDKRVADIETSKFRYPAQPSTAAPSQKIGPPGSE